MNRRIDYQEFSAPMMKQLIDMGMTCKQSPLGPTLLNLVNIRLSQINGCAFCLDMHIKEAKIHGERDLRIYHLPIWHESPLFSDKEKACLEWAEAVNRPGPRGIGDEIFERARKHLSEKELSDLTFAAGIIGVFNRLNISSPTTPGSLDKMFGLDKAGLS